MKIIIIVYEVFVKQKKRKHSANHYCSLYSLSLCACVRVVCMCSYRMRSLYSIQCVPCAL
jgi:hypothetical protein